MRRVLSWKRLLLVVGVLIVLGTVTAALHAVQARRQSASVRKQADDVAREAEADPSRRDQAITLYERYLRFRPRDEEAARKYTELIYARMKADPSPENIRRSANVAEALLRNFPNNPPQRRELIRLYMKHGPLASARQHLTVFLDPDRGTHKDDIELLEMAATCEVGFQDFGKAAACLQKAIDTGNASLKVYVMALEVNQKNTTDTLRESKIAAYMETLLRSERFRNDVSARIAAGRFQLGRGELKNARQNILYALNDLPGGKTDPEALQAAALLALDDSKLPDKSAEYLALAESHLDKAFALDPKNTSVALLLAAVKRDLMKMPEAVAVLRRAADATGEVNDSFFRVIDMMIDLEQADPAESMLPRIATSDPKLMMTRYFRGRIAVVRKNWSEARALLEVVEKELTARALRDYHKKALVGLALCYTVYQNPDRQLLLYVEALKDDPIYLPALVGQAEALAKLGRTDEALLGRPNEGRPGFRALVNNYKVAAGRPTLVRLEFLHAVRRPAARTWAAFDESLGPPVERTPEIHLMHAESLAARGQVADAVTLLDDLLDKFPNYAAGWVALTRIKHAWKADETLAQLDATEKRSGETMETRLARASLLPARAKKPTADEYRKLATGIEKFKPGDLHRFWFQLGEAAMRATVVQTTPETTADMRNVAIMCFQEAAKLDALDLTARAVLVDLGEAAKRQDVIDTALAEIAKIEGPDGPIGNLSQVVVRLPGAKGNPTELAELRAKAIRVRDARQGWGRVYVALARLDELIDRKDDALTNYRKAIDHGERTEFVIRRAVELLWDQKKDDEAYKLLNSLYTEVPLPDDLERFRAIKDLLARDLPRSERPTIDRIAPANAGDYRLLLLRGSLLAAIGENDDALKAFRLAVDRDDTIPETWASLVAHLVRTGKLDEAKQAVAHGEQKLKTNPPTTTAKKADLTLALAECYSIVGDNKTAGERYQQAVELQPRDLEPNKQLVTFLQRSGQGDKAAALLEKLAADPAPDLSRWARRQYATVLMMAPNRYDLRHRALGLVSQNLQTGPPNAEDIKTKAMVQTIDPDTRVEGERVLKEYADKGDLTPDEYFWLARLYFESGRVLESVDYFTAAARPRRGVTAEHLAGLVRAQLIMAEKKNSNDLTAAERALERLKAMAPGTWEATREEARLLHRRALVATKSGEPEKAREFDVRAKKLIADFPGGQTEAAIPAVTGPLLEELGFAAEAETLYRHLLELSKSPGAHRSLALFLIRQKRSAEAIALARKYESTSPLVLTAAILSAAVRINSPGPTAEQEVLAWLDARMKEFEARPDARPVLAALIGSRAQVFDAQGKNDRSKYDQAIAEYRRALSIAPSDLMTNNLAMLIALQHPAQVREAIDLMNKLIGVRGPIPLYLDTRAVCYLVAGGAYKTTGPDGKEVDGPELARRDLELAILQIREPAYLYHLAWAYQLKGDQPQLLLRMLEAIKDGATPEMVHPLELPKFRELSALAGR